MGIRLTMKLWSNNKKIMTKNKNNLKKKNKPTPMTTPPEPQQATTSKINPKISTWKPNKNISEIADYPSFP